MTLRPFKELVT